MIALSSKSTFAYHQPVMLSESLQGLDIQPQGIYVDLTFGGGGHSKAILDHLKGGKLVAFDQDEAAAQIAGQLHNPAFIFIQANARFMDRFLAFHKIEKVDGVLADLGISSHQIDTPNRGFSTRTDGYLDMRMDRTSELTAKEIINTYSLDQLVYLLQNYGEVNTAHKLAKAILTARTKQPIQTTEQLKALATPFSPPRKNAKFLAQVFQAFRIEVNDEINALKEILAHNEHLLKRGGRLVVLSYHSLEDRLVKRFIKTGNFKGEPQKDLYGNLLRPFKPIYSKPLTPSEGELQENARARSAKLRIGERI